MIFTKLGSKELTSRFDKVGPMPSMTLLLALVAPSAAFYLGHRCTPARPTSDRLSPVVAAAEKHATVIFLRHGQSEWNAASLFTGWADVRLSIKLADS